MAEEILARYREVSLYMEHAREMLEVAQLNLEGGFYASAVNRAYYAIFYAANAVLATKGLARNKHSGVISAFRQQFVKTGLIEAIYSDIYGRVMDQRHQGDYDLVTSIDEEQIQDDLDDARGFVDGIHRWLTQEGWL